MTKAYPEALRWRVVYLMQRGFRVNTIAETLSVGKTFVKKVVFLYENTRDVSYPSRRKSKQRRLSAADLRFIRLAIDDRPELYLDELQAWLETQTGETIPLSTLYRALNKMGLTVKKMQLIARERDERRRAAYRRFIGQFPSQRLLFVDESSKDERTTQRKYGRCLVNSRVSKIGAFTRGTRYSVLAAVSSTGIKATHSIVGAYNREQFEFAMEHYVLPHVGTFALGEPCSVVIMDNCNIHFSEDIVDRVKENGGLVVFLPPYSPDLNPIEECFSIGKSWLKRYPDICEKYPQRCFEIALENISESACSNVFQDCSYM